MKKKLGDLLVEKEYITEAQLQEGLREQVISGKRLGEVLVEREYITEDQLLETISDRLGVPRISLNQMVLDPQVTQKVSVDLARRYTLIPIFAIGNTLTLAMADPLNIVAIDEIKYVTGADIKRAVALSSEIRGAIDEYYSVADSLMGIIGTPAETEGSGADSVDVESEESETPVVKLVNLIITKAVKDRATDVHIEPEESRLRVRYRVDGVMREEATPPKSMQGELISRVKIAANLDVSEKRLPQDGRFVTTVDGNTVDMRVSTLPTIHGEKIVIRLLDRRNLLFNFNQLGFTATVEERWKNLIVQPEGLVLITGPTSSGKTSTLYATLQEINSVEKNIITVEDPVEYSLGLIVQIQINEKAGLTFPTTLRAMLRQNPDIIMIGEIRDSETARMAVRSALTGHLVFSTVHTNDAPSAITRLIDMGIEKYLVASAIKGVLAQRLVRLNCPECSESYWPSDNVLSRAMMIEMADAVDFQRGVGCVQCKNTGLKGLTGIYEYVEMTPTISEMILDGASLNQIKDEARRHGYVPLFEMGLEKVTSGKVCLEELIKETSNVEDWGDAAKPHAVSTVHADSV
ncbi:MAG: ATPase, T2SS/T4P/T4SS family [candidate division Zixibacteria bacterium]|nr:ATPase, T2SS/T4P/T4SS family [candidate division Zixibacteria bacterium]MDH3937764.1 ATPase, T2SS/T4P/T4SS family [candidate division Zixibacteria bacterium]MDH4035476.1 ATPase, T2SS/T4P/T4SS family [candidate division Zixibacteria bacterium]